MLRLKILIEEQWNEKTGEFIPAKEQTLQLEHSLVSLSKWESKWQKSFLKNEKTDEEILDYVRCMTITQNVDPEVYNHLSAENVQQINDYISAPMTATKFFDSGPKKGVHKETITAELIYYWMITFNIPFECQKWHLNRLLTLIEVCDRKNRPQKKMSQREIMQRNAALNKARREKFNTKG